MPTIRVPTPMRPALGGLAEVQVEGRTVLEAFRNLVERYPEAADRLFRPDGTLHPHLMVVVDGLDVPALSTAVNPDSEIIIIPAIGGGSPGCP